MSRIGNLIKKAQAYKGQEFKQPRLFVPSGMIVPETAKTTMARQLYQAGIITKDDYEKMLGVTYDGDFKLNEEDFDDESFSTFGEEFKLSELAEYYDDLGETEEPNSSVLEKTGTGDLASSTTALPEARGDNQTPRNSDGSRADDGESKID